MPGAAPIHDPACQHAILHNGAGLTRHAFPIKGAGTQAALARRVIMHRQTLGQDLLAHGIFKEGRAARHCRTIDGAQQMPKDGTRNARVQHHRNARGFGAHRVQPTHCLFRRHAPNQGGVRQIGQINRLPIIIIPLHPRALAGDSGRGNAMRCARILPGEAIGRNQGNLGPAPAGAGAFTIGDALHRERRFFRRCGACQQGFGGGFSRVFQIQRAGGNGNGFRQAGKRVFRHHACHRHRTFRQSGKASWVRFRGSDNRLALADEYPQAKIKTFGAFQLFNRPQAPIHGKRG